MTLGSAGSVTTTDLYGLTRWYAGTSNTSNFTDAQALGLINRWLHQIQVWIIEAHDGWKFNTSTRSSINLVAGTQSYTAPTDILDIHRIELNYAGGNDNWVVAKIIDERSFPSSLRNLEDSSDQTSGGPAIVYLRQGTIFLLRPPANAVTGGILVHHSVVQTELASSGDEPIIVENFHKYIAMGAALDYVLVNFPERAANLKALLDEGRRDIQAFYSNRIKNEQDSIQPRSLGRTRLYE